MQRGRLRLSCEETRRPEGLGAGAADARLDLTAAARAHARATPQFERTLAETDDGHQIADPAGDGGEGGDVGIEVHAVSVLSARMWMRLEVQLATPPIGYVGVQLGRRQVCMPQHLLDRT